MTKFLVVSYDPDEQQWFYDTVISKTPNDAAGVICRIRPYVVDADATSITELRGMPKRMAKRTAAQVKASLLEIAIESGVVDTQEDADTATMLTEA